MIDRSLRLQSREVQNPRFSQDAVEYIEKIEKRIILVDGQRLAELMIAHGVEVSDVTS